MLKVLAGLMGLAMQVSAQVDPPQILQIHRELLRPGREAAYQEIEEDTARICGRLGCPHPYLSIEALTGSKEVWFFNGYESLAESERVVKAYSENSPLMAALQENSKRKAKLTLKPVSVFAEYRQGLSQGVPWMLGAGRFLVITVTKNNRRIDGTVFETADGTRFVVMSAQTREEADAKAVAAGSEAKVFAVRPYWSMPAKEWVAADPAFWQPSPPKTVK
jgi:hypothetical protein